MRKKHFFLCSFSFSSFSSFFFSFLFLFFPFFLPPFFLIFPCLFHLFPFYISLFLSLFFILKAPLVHSDFFIFAYSYFFLFLSLLSYRAMLSCVNLCTFTHEKMHAPVNSYVYICSVALTTSVN